MKNEKIMIMPSKQRRRLSCEEFKKKFASGNQKKQKKEEGVFLLSSIVDRKIHALKEVLQNARKNTSECVTIVPEKEVFEAIVAEMLNRPLKVS